MSPATPGRRPLSCASSATGTASRWQVRDDGRGIDDGEARSEGAGLGGMRKRALLIGGRLTVGRTEPRGTEVRLDVPVSGG